MGEIPSPRLCAQGGWRWEALGALVAPLEQSSYNAAKGISHCRARPIRLFDRRPPVGDRTLLS
jgi:hypothetical protein